MVHRREVQGEVIVFGNQGALMGNAMTWWDHDTGSVWSQPLGEAVMGERTGEKLELLASQLTSWSTWRSEHPATVALDAPAGVTRFNLASMTIVADFGADVAVYPYTLLQTNGPANDVVAGVPIAVVLDPDKPDNWVLLNRVAADRVLTLTVEDGLLRDEETGTVWDPSNGLALEGPLQGEVLGVLPGFTSFLRDTKTFWPDARVWEG